MVMDMREIKRLERFYEAYALGPEESVKLVAPPFISEREIHHEWNEGSRAMSAKRLPDGMLFHFRNGKLLRDGSRFGDLRLMQLVTKATGLGKQMLSGRTDLLQQGLVVDLVYDPDAPIDDRVRDLEAALQMHLARPFSLALRKEEREVLVASGSYEYAPMVARESPWQDLYITGEDRWEDDNMTGGSTGDFGMFLDWVGRHVGLPVIADDIVGAPYRVQWQKGRHIRNQANQIIYPPPDDHVRAVLRAVAAQTGLQFRRETRRVQVLSVEPELPDG